LEELDAKMEKTMKLTLRREGVGEWLWRRFGGTPRWGGESGGGDARASYKPLSRSHQANNALPPHRYLLPLILQQHQQYKHTSIIRLSEVDIGEQ
jgi:hypothetical protein